MISFVFLLLPTLAASFSIFYSAKSQHPAVIGQTTFASAPNAVQVADIYARVSGKAPILTEVNGLLPSIDILHKSTWQPVILNLVGGDIPLTVKPIVSVTKNDKGPVLSEIEKALKKHNIVAKTHEMVNPTSSEVSSWIEQQEQPVVILHQDLIDFQSRRLQTTDNATTAPLSEEEISSYQITLWTGVAIFLLILASVCSIVGMDVVPDSLLFAKFQSSRTNKSD